MRVSDKSLRLFFKLETRRDPIPAHEMLSPDTSDPLDFMVFPRHESSDLMHLNTIADDVPTAFHNGTLTQGDVDTRQ